MRKVKQKRREIQILYKVHPAKCRTQSDALETCVFLARNSILILSRCSLYLSLDLGVLGLVDLEDGDGFLYLALERLLVFQHVNQLGVVDLKQHACKELNFVYQKMICLNSVLAS